MHPLINVKVLLGRQHWSSFTAHHSQRRSSPFVLAGVLGSIDVNPISLALITNRQLLTILNSAILISAAVFISGRNKYIRVPPVGSAILDACRTTSIAIKEKGFPNARPSVLRASGHNDKYPLASQERYTDEYVGDVQRGLKSCKVSDSSHDLQDEDLQWRLDVPVLPVLLHLLEPDVE